MKASRLPAFFAPLFATGLHAASITWDQPSAINNWNTTDANWTGGATYANGDDAIFNAAVGETVTVDAGGVTPASTTITGNGAWTFTGGSILGGTLAKSGTGALTLSNTGGNSFSGITLTGSGAGTGLFGSTNGSLRFANGNTLGSGTIDFSAVSNVSTGFYATATTTVTNAVVLPTSFGWGVTHLNGNTTTFSGIISGGAATNRVTLGAGTTSNPTSVTLLTNASNSFKGEIYLGRGVLAITSNGALGDAANVINMDQGGSNGQLRFDANNIDVTHKIQQRTTTSYNVNGFDATLSGEISFSGGTTVRGGTNTLGTSAGTLTVTGSNLSTSPYTIAADTKFIAASVNGLGGGTKTVSAGGTVAFKNVGTYTSAGQINLNGSGAQIASVGVGALENIAGANVFNNTVNLASASTIGVTADSLTFGGNLTGAFALTKIGSGTLTLNGTIAATSIIVNEGILGLGSPLTLAGKTLVAGRAGAPATDISGSVLTGTGNVSIRSGSNVGILSISGDLTVDGGNVNLDLSNNPSSGNDQIVVGGALNLTAPATISLNRINNALGAGTYVLAMATSTSGDIANITFNGLPAPGSSRQTFTPSLSSTQLTLTVGGTPANLIWNNAAATGNWSQDVSNENWDNTTAPDAQDRFFASDIVTFQDISGQPTQSVAIATAVEPGSIFVSNSVAGTAYTLTGEGIAGTTGITKTGTGTLNIAGTAHTFTGSVNLNGGTVKVALIDDATFPSSLGQGTSLSFDGGELGYDEAFDAFTNRSITLQAGGGAIRVGDAATKLDLKAAIDGPGGFTKTGDGSVVLRANNSYAGTTTISAGTLQVGNGSTTGTLSTADVSIGGSLVINRSDAITLANNLSGAGSLVKAAANILTLTGTNIHGATTINAGTISIGAATNLGSGALTFANVGTGLTITGAAVTLANNIALPASGTGNINLTTPNTSSTVFDGTLSGGAVGTVLFFQGGALSQNTGSLTLNGNNTGLVGSIQIQRGPLILGNANAAGSATIVLNSNNAITGALQLAGSFTIANNIQIIDAGENIGVGTGLSAGISGVISGGNPITKVGAGTLTLSNTNTYTGTTAVSAGELRITGILETGGGTVTVATAGTLSGDGVINRAVTVNGSIAPGSGAVETLEITGATTINGTYACQLDAATTDSLAITGNLTLGAASVLNVAETTAATTFPYVIATYSGTLTGTFATVTPGYTVDYGTAGTILLKQGTAYDSWAALKGLDGTPGKENGLNDDPDSDGLDNVIEFVLDNDPLSGTNANPPTINASGSDLVFTYTRRDDSEYLNPFVEFDADLVAPWTVAVDPGNATIAVAENGSNPDVVTVTIPKGANTKLFARLNVTVP